MKNTFIKITAITLLLAIAPSATWARSEKPKFQCDLTVYEDRVLTNKVKVAEVSGGWDYTGRKWWWDIALFPVCIAGFGLILMGGVYCFGAEYGMLNQGDNWTDSLTAKPAPESWYEDTRREAVIACNSFIRSHAPEDIIFEDGEYVLARHYECGKPYIKKRSSSNEVMVDIFRGEPAYPNSNPELLLQKKCTKLSTCLAEATMPEQVQWVNEMQMQLGCP